MLLSYNSLFLGRLLPQYIALSVCYMVSGQKSEWTKVRVIKCRTFVHSDFCPMTGQVSTGQDRSEQVKTGHDWSGQVRTGLDRSGQVKSEYLLKTLPELTQETRNMLTELAHESKKVLSELAQEGQDRSGRDRLGHERSGVVCKCYMRWLLELKKSFLS